MIWLNINNLRLNTNSKSDWIFEQPYKGGFKKYVFFLPALTRQVKPWFFIINLQLIVITYYWEKDVIPRQLSCNRSYNP